MIVPTRTLLLALLFTSAAHADWPQFRGPNSSGIAATGSPPVEFGPGKNELWKVDLADGHSSPCIVGEQIYLTTVDADENLLNVVCLDRWSGKQLWVHTVTVAEMEKGHPSFNPASSSPACDGNHVVAYFGSYGLVCLSVDGSLQWERKFPLAKSFGGNATSPMIAGKRVFIYRGNYVDHFLMALDVETGEELWKVDQAEPFSPELACTACPIIAGDRLIVHSARSLQAIDPANGRQIWVAKCATTATSTPVVAGDHVLVAAWNKMGEAALRPSFPDFQELLEKHDTDGDKTISRKEFPTLWIFHRPEGTEAPMNGATVRFQRADHDKNGKLESDEWARQLAGLEKYRAGYETHGLMAIPIDSQGVIDPSTYRVLETNGIPEVPSPIFDGQYVYMVKNGGVVTCLDVESGQRVYRKRTGGRGTHYASPIIADGKLYTTSGDGHITVMKLGAEPEILTTNEIGENVFATPAIAGNTIFVRTHSALYAFGNE